MTYEPSCFDFVKVLISRRYLDHQFVGATALVPATPHLSELRRDLAGAVPRFIANDWAIRRPAGRVTSGPLMLLIVEDVVEWAVRIMR